MRKLLTALAIVVLSFVPARADALTFTQIGSSYDTSVQWCEPALFGGVCSVKFGLSQPIRLWIASTGRVLAIDLGTWIPLGNSVYFICTEDHGCAFDPVVV